MNRGKTATVGDAVSIIEAAKLRGVSVNTLYRWFRAHPEDWTEVWTGGRRGAGTRLVYLDELAAFEPPRPGPRPTDAKPTDRERDNG